MSDIFICYSRTDATVAETLAERLEAQGWSVYRDVKTQVGKSWHEEIEAELHASKAVIVLWSSKSRGSHEVLDEARYAKDNGKLFPTLIQQILRPLGFGGIQTADLIGWTGEQEHPGLTQLFTALRMHLNVGETRPASIDPAQPPVTQPEAAQAPTARISSGQTFRDKLKWGGEGPLMVVIPAGHFLMGSPPDESDRGDREGPQHEVRIAEPFAIGVYVVTFEEYDRFCDATNQAKPKDKNWGRGRRPVINVSWDDAKTYCRWLTEQSGRAYRLPSEAEWEYACRAGTKTPFHFADIISADQANFDGNYPYNRSAKGKYRKRTEPVGSFAPNAFGLYDMHGNVWEWCQDNWHENYQGGPDDGSPWEEGKSVLRVLRGGAWDDGAAGARSAARDFNLPVDRLNHLGFRVLCVSPIE